MRVVLASWNVHAWVGRDGVRDPGRTFEAIRRLDADVIALQEAEGSDWMTLAESSGFRAILGATASRPFGNVLLVRERLLEVRRIDLSVSGREKRGALDAIVSFPDGPLRIVATHFGLRAGERRQQAARLARHILEHEESVPVALLGDLNDWTPWGNQLRPLVRALGPLSRIPTFPSRRPVFPLDRAAWRAPGLHARLESIRHPRVRVLSDHLPLRLELRDGSGTSETTRQPR